MKHGFEWPQVVIRCGKRTKQPKVWYSIVFSANAQFEMGKLKPSLFLQWPSAHNSCDKIMTHQKVKKSFSDLTLSHLDLRVVHPPFPLHPAEEDDSQTDQVLRV